MTAPSDLRPVPGHDLIFVAPSPLHGLGVFAARSIPVDTVVHVAPVILMSAADVDIIDPTPLHGLVYGWETDGSGTCAFALGYGSLFNHSAAPNCAYHRIDAGDDDGNGSVHRFDALSYTTVRGIEPGEELTVDYSGGDPSILWFEPR